MSNLTQEIPESEALKELLERTTTLKTQCLNGEISLLNEDLRSIFQELQEKLQPAELETAISIMDNGTIILQQKLEEINRFIYHLIEKESIVTYLRSATDQELCNLLTACWQSPTILPHFSVSFLIQSWNHLVKDKKPRIRIGIPSIVDIDTKPIITTLGDPNEPFEIQMRAFYVRIQPLLPCSIGNFFALARSTDEYFEYFSYFLHLLQNGLLQYDKNHQQILDREGENTTNE